MELVSFIPQTASYQIWHPPDFIITEDEDSIVTITSPTTYSNLTISGYQSSQIVTERILENFLESRTQAYTALSEIGAVRSTGKIWIERECRNEKAFWVWWALAVADQIILASINSEEILSEGDRHLFMFMIDKMEIYPNEVNEE